MDIVISHNLLQSLVAIVPQGQWWKPTPYYLYCLYIGERS